MATGAGSGIGAVIAARDVSAGALVAIADLNRETARATAAALTASGHGKAMAVAEIAVRFAAFPSNAVTGQSLIVSRGRCVV